MPWRASSVVEERLLLVARVLNGRLADPDSYTPSGGVAAGPAICIALI
jgi:hypothetical protein